MESKYDIEKIKNALDLEYERYLNDCLTDSYIQEQITFDDIYDEALDYFIDKISDITGISLDEIYDSYDNLVDVAFKYAKNTTKYSHRRLENLLGIHIDSPFPNTQEEIDQNVESAFFRGSIVYGIEPTDKSDIDIVAIVKDCIKLPHSFDGRVYDYEDDYKVGNSDVIDQLLARTAYPNVKMFKNRPIHVSYIKKSDFLKMIIDYDCHMIALEGIFLPQWAFIGPQEDYEKYFTLDTWKLRQTVSAIVNNSWAKCHKKLTVEEDYDWYRAVKSLFHCFRLYTFAKQIAQFGKIVDYSEANNYWDEIYNDTPSENQWEYYKEKYQPRLNSLRSEFVKLAPKPL